MPSEGVKEADDEDQVEKNKALKDKSQKNDHIRRGRVRNPWRVA